MANAEPFQSSLEHILAEMKRLDLMLRRAVLLARRARKGDVADEFRGLVITDENIDNMLGSVDFLGDIWKMDDEARRTVASIDEELENRQATIRERMQASDKAGQKLTLAHLAASCGLSPAEVDVLLIALAPELEPRYETLYAYLQNDVTRKRPSVDLGLNLICRTEQEKLNARDIFSPDSALPYFNIVELHEEPYDRHPTLLRRFLKMNEAVSRFLLEGQAAATPASKLLSPTLHVADLETSEQTRGELENLVSILTQGVERPVIQLWGDSEAPLMAAAESIASALGRDVLHLDISQAEVDSTSLGGSVRDAALWDTLFVLDNTKNATLDADRQKQSRREQQLWQHLSETAVPVVVLSSEDRFGPIPPQAQLWRMKIDPPDFESRRQAWGRALSRTVNDLDADRLADLFPFSGGRIQQISSLTVSRARLRDPQQPSPKMSDVMTAARDLTTPNLQRYALMIEPKHTWGDLVLPEDRLQQLHAVASRLQYRNIVHREWGFAEKLVRSRGLSAMICGPTGAGKTLAAEVLAHELSLHLFQIDLSAVVSKYIGETELRLSEIFREAELSQSLLFFDEADALFGKRTEIKDAHDRYANIEVNYLLQRMEQYQGLVVLATNFQKNLDEAFLRRLHFVLEFPFPDEDAREKIWRLHLAGAPADPEVDFQFLASQFQLSGGSIRNVVVEAAFLAAEQRGPKGPITMEHLLEALKHEYQKQGKLVMKTDLGRYARVG